MAVRTPRRRNQPRASSSFAMVAGIAAVLLLVVLFVLNRERRSAAPSPEGATEVAASPENGSFKGKTPAPAAPAAPAAAPSKTPAPKPASSLVPAPTAPDKKPPEAPVAAPVEPEAPAPTASALPAVFKDKDKPPPEKPEAKKPADPAEKPADAARKPAPATKPANVAKKAATQKEEPLSLRANEVEAYLNSISKVNESTATAGGLVVKARLVPDLLTFRAAERARELFEKGFPAERVLAEVTSYFRNRRANEAGKPLLLVTVSPAGGSLLFMVPTTLSKSFKLRFDETTIACEVKATNKLPTVTQWKVWFGQVSGSRTPTVVSLHYLTEPLQLEMTAGSPWPVGKNLSIAVTNFRHVADKARGPDLEGVNPGAKQIHKPDRESFSVQTEVSFKRSRFRDIEPPPAFKALMAEPARS